MSLQLKEWLTYLAILIISLAVLIAIKPKITYEPKGIVLPMTSQATENIVKSPGWRFPAKPIAWVNLEYHVTHDSKAAKQIVFNRASVMAHRGKTSSVMMVPSQFYKSNEAGGMMSMMIGRGFALENL